MSAFEERCKKAQGLMKSTDTDWLFVSVTSDLRYLTGYKGMQLERLSLFMLPQEGTATFVMPKFEAPKLKREGLDVFYDVKTWEETDNPIKIVKETVGTKKFTVAICDQLWAMFLLPIQDVLSSSNRYIRGNNILGQLRVHKDALEVANLLEVGKRMDKVFLAASHIHYGGRTEKEVAEDIFGIVRDMGLNPTRCGGVASGPNSGSAHHVPTDRKIQAGDGIWLELGQGGSYEGYMCDMTRNVFVGEPSQEYIKIHKIVKAAQNAAWHAVRPGIECQEIDRIARRIISEAGYGDYFTHRVGHGLGLDIHEDPYMFEGNTNKIEPGMCFSVEPGIYLPGKFGIREEDIVIATEDGVLNLYKSPHEFAVVD